MRKSKLLLMILALVVVLAMVAACGNDEDDNGNGDDDNGGNDPISTAPPTGGGNEVTPEPEVPVGPAAIPRPGGLVYSLETDAYVQHAGPGVRGYERILTGDVAYLMNAGGPTWNTVESPLGGVGLSFTARGYDWHGVDILFPAMNLDLDNNAYMLTVVGRIVGGGVMGLGGADSPWSVFVESDGSPDFELSLLIDAELIAAAGSRGHVRIRSVDNVNDFFVDAITITNYIPTAENIVYQLSADPFVQFAHDNVRNEHALTSPNIMSAGSPSYGNVEGPYGRAISVTSREAGYHALDLIYIGGDGVQVLDIDLENNTYLLTVRGNVAGGGTFIIGGADNPWGWLANVETDGDFEVSFEMTYDTVYGIGDDNPGTGIGSGGRRNMRLQTDNMNDFTIYEIIIERQ